MGEVGDDRRSLEGTIVFATVGRALYSFDVFAVSVPTDFWRVAHGEKLREQRLTDGLSVNSNGHLVEGSEKENVLKFISKSTPGFESLPADKVELLTYVSERGGELEIYFNIFIGQAKHDGSLEALFKSWGGLKGAEQSSNVVPMRSLLGKSSQQPYLEDRPQVAGGRLVFVSTKEPASKRESWTAVYSVNLTSAEVTRLTPEGVSDFSPSISPSGKWVIVASFQGKGWQGEIEELYTDLYVLDATDGSRRRFVTKNAGWPTWSDDSTIYFHRKSEDGWWSVYTISFTEGFLSSGAGEIEETRITPPKVHAFTPSASRTGNWIAVATRRPGAAYRHVEIFELSTKTFIKVTENISPNAHHYNPSVSASGKISYHRCRGYDPQHVVESTIPRLEPLVSGIPGLALLRLDGAFPTFKHDGSLLAYVRKNFDGVDVTKPNGEGQRKIFSGISFGSAWDWQRKDVLYVAAGVPFSPESAEVHIIAISNADDESSEPQYKQLTKTGHGNNAFPSPSPDGKYVVFRSGRSGYKNLYIMDAVDGEEAGIRQLTEGPWTDTMPSWSSSGEWIAFSSNRENPEEGHFAGYLIHPDGTGLTKVLSDGGRVNHLFFSPDSKSLVFTSDFAAVSAEPISVPHQFQPYGEIYISKIDGSDVQRLTHNAYEDGTPTWGPVCVNYSDLSPEHGDPVSCGFDDVHWLGNVGTGEHNGSEETSKPPATWCPRVQTTK